MSDGRVHRRTCEGPIVKETRGACENLVAESGGDVDALGDHLEVVQERYGDRVVTGRPKARVGVERKISRACNGYSSLTRKLRDVASVHADELAGMSGSAV